MEKKVISLELETTGFDQVEQQTKSLKAQLREAQSEVAQLSEKFGATSAEAVKAAKKAAELKDAIADAKDLTDSFNPDAKFNSLTRSIGGAMDGFSAFQGTLGLIGVESQDVEKMILKVQSAMALSQGLQGLLEAKDSFKQLGAVISQTTLGQKALTAAQIVGTSAMKVLNAVMKANPVFLIIGGITALIGAFKYFTSSTETAEKANEKLNLSLERQLQLTESLANESKRRNDKALELLQAQGASEEELHLKKLDNMAIEKYQRDNLINSELYAIKEKNKLYKKALKEENFEVAKTIADEIKAHQGKYKDLIIANKNYHDDVKIENTKFSNSEIEEQNKKNEEAIQKSKDNNEKAKQYKKEAIDNIKALEAEYALYQKTEQEKEIFLVEEKYKKALEDAKKYGKDNSQLLLAQKNELNDIDAKYIQLQIERAEKTAEELKAIQEKANADYIQAQDDRFNLENEINLNEDEKKKIALQQAYEKQIEIAGDDEGLIKQATKKLQDDLTKIDEESIAKEKERKRNHIFQIAQMSSDALNLVATIAEDNAGKDLKRQKKAFELRKIANLAQATIDGTKAVLSTYADTPGGPIIKGIAAGIAGAFSLAQIKKIASAKFEGGAPSGGGGNSMSSGGATQTVTSSAPSFQIVGNAGANPLANLGGNPIKAYVVSQEVTTSQELDRNHIKNATFQ